jgi:VWFA-related protein
MRRLVIGLCCVSWCAALIASQQPTPSFSATANLVVVPTVVVDKKGALVHGLTVDAFQVFEDGRQMAIEAFVPPDESGAGVDGRFIVLVLDNLRTSAELRGRVQAIARRFADRMGPSDDVSVITLSRGRASSATSPADVRAAIDRFRPALNESVHGDADDVRHGLETIATLSRQIAKVPHRRKVLVFIGDASIFSPKDPSVFFDREPILDDRWFEAIQATGLDNVSVYVIDPAGLTGNVEDYSQGFAEQTGGAAWANRGNFDAAVEQIWSESGRYYLLGYRAPVNNRRVHTIDVKVNVPGVVVRARRARG